MRNAMCPCPSCALALDVPVRWGRLVVREPEVFVHEGPWGISRFELGVTEFPVRCPRCGETQNVCRDQPLALA
jgi:hypothetical protein